MKPLPAQPHKNFFLQNNETNKIEKQGIQF